LQKIFSIAFPSGLQYNKCNKKGDCYEKTACIAALRGPLPVADRLPILGRSVHFAHL
jgi:hypothetical protein